MRRLLVYTLILIGGGLATWLLPAPGLRFYSNRSATVRLEPIGYDLTYTVSWGRGMDHKFALDPDGTILGGPSSGWLEVWDKPNNAVLTVYRSLDGKIYYLSTGWGPAYIFDAPSKTLRSDCLYSYPLELTELGRQLKNLSGQGYEATEVADPKAPRQRSYVEADDRGEIPAEPPRSRYYADIVYLGKFGVVPNARGGGRGEDVGFAPAGKTPEPRFGFSASCG